MKTSFELKQSFSVSAKEIYEAWLSSEKHTAMTGGDAKCSNEEGASFNAWDGYISGKNVRLNPNELIIQSWRTSEFSDSDEASQLTIMLYDTSIGCEIHLTHTDIPEGQSDYKKGWIEHYFEPMTEYFKI